jgi:hypothetical protein
MSEEMSEEMVCRAKPDPAAIKNFLSNVEGFDFKVFETCPDIVNSTMDGGKKQRKTRRKMRGGFPPSRAEIRTALWVIIAVFVAYVGVTADSTTITSGVRLLLKGQCFNVAEIGLGFFGLGNPVCTAWRTLVTVVGYALLGNPTAITQIAGLVAAGVAAPVLTVKAVDQVAGLIENQVIARLGNGAPAIGNIPPNPRVEEIEGGKRRKRHSKRHKRHTRRHKRHTRRH